MVTGVLVFISKDGVGQLSRTVSGEWLGQSHSPRLYPRASQPHTILLRPQSLPGTACRDNKDTKTISLIIIRGTYLKKYSILELELYFNGLQKGSYYFQCSRQRTEHTKGLNYLHLTRE